MQKISKIFVVLGIVAGILLVGGLIGWLAGGARKHAGDPGTPVTESADPKPSAANPPHVTRPTGDTNAISPANPDEATPLAVGASSVVTNWEEKLDEILTPDTDNTNKVKQLLALYPRVPEDAKSEIAQHLSNLTDDEHYAELGELLKDGSQPDTVLDVLMSDALNRPNSVKLPELLAVAQANGHPKADEAKDILALFLDEDYGTDWSKWQEKMAAWLKDNPD